MRKEQFSKPLYVTGGYGDIYEITKIPGSTDRVLVTNIDHPAPSERLAITVLEEFAAGWYTISDPRDVERVKERGKW